GQTPIGQLEQLEDVALALVVDTTVEIRRGIERPAGEGPRRQRLYHGITRRSTAPVPPQVIAIDQVDRGVGVLPGGHHEVRRGPRLVRRSEEHTSELQSPCNLV